jgi:putative ABC transport system permease protein
MFIAGEGLLMAVLGGLIGAALAWVIVDSRNFPVSGGFIPPFGVTGRNVVVGIALSAVIGVLAGMVPATMASRLNIVDALRRVA